jgi:hypothetical protein
VIRKKNTRHDRRHFSLGDGPENQNRCWVQRPCGIADSPSAQLQPACSFPVQPQGKREIRLCHHAFFFLLICLTPLIGVKRTVAEINAIQVQQSIDRGVEYLRKTQNARGGWNEFGNQSCGLSALCTLAWVNAGVSREDPGLQRALDYLRTFQPDKTYSVSLQTLVFCQVGAPQDVARIHRNVDWLVAQQKAAGDRNEGAWTYGLGPGSGDQSNAQFAVLALGAAADRGIEIDPEVFKLAAIYWREHQLRQGGWGYGSSRQASGSMTCAGIASMIICGGSLQDLKGNQDNRLRCCGGEAADDTIQQGLDHLSRIFTVRANPGGELLSYFYYLYAVERVGRLSGRRLIGNRDWYREGAEQLVGLQDKFQGFWKGGGPVESNRDIATSFALLFLSKGKRQVVIGRLDHPSTRDTGAVLRENILVNRNSGESVQSQPHPTSLQTLVRHVEKDWSRELTWQTIDGEQASVEDLLQTPVLVIAGGGQLVFDESLTQRLREYLDQGGTILFDALAGDSCGNDREFRRSVEKLCENWFPSSLLQPLPASHPVWFAERFVNPKTILDDTGDVFQIEGVQACCRTPIFYSRQSLMCRWSYGGPLLRKVDLPEGIEDQVVAGITIGENILAYATGRELKDKLDAVNRINADEAPAPTRGAIPIALAAMGAGERQVNRALPNAAAIIRDRLAIEVIAANRPIALTDESLARVGVLYLTGQTEFQLDAEAKTALKNYVDGGGILIASPICGEEAFAKPIRELLSEISGGKSLQPMGKDHPAFGTRFGSYDVTQVAIRRPNQAGSNTSKPEPLKVFQRFDAPIIEVIKTAGVDNVFYSPLDLSCALESPNSIQCPGYTTEDAAKIMAGLILYGLNQ